MLHVDERMEAGELGAQRLLSDRQFESHEPDAPVQPMTQRRVLGLAIPIIGENLLHTLVVAVDTLMVSRLGTEEVAEWEPRRKWSGS